MNEQSTDRPKARVQRISLDKQEGVPEQRNCFSFAAANRTLRGWANDAPKAGGYDKVAVELIWENSFRFNFRLDLEHPSKGEEPDLTASLQHMIGFALGEMPNPNWSDAQYQRILERYKAQGMTAAAQAMRDTCMLSDC